MKNFGKKIVSILAATVIASSVAAVTAVSASATSVNDTKGVVSFQPCGDYGRDNAKMVAYFFNKYTGNGQWKDMADPDHDGTFTVGVPAGSCDQVVFARVEQGFVNGNTGTWNQTYDLAIENGKTYKATGYENKDGKDFYVGYWDGQAAQPEQKPEQKPESKIISTITVAPSNEWNRDGAVVKAYFYNKDNNKNIWVNAGRRSANASVYTVNVPDGYTHVIFVRFAYDNTNLSFDNALNKTADINLAKITNGTYKINGWELNKFDEGKNTALY